MSRSSTRTRAIEQLKAEAPTEVPPAFRCNPSNKNKRQRIGDAASNSATVGSGPIDGGALPAPTRRPARTRVKGMRGSLNMMVEMPFDILLEIFKHHLEPVDLLNLASVNRTFRALLLDRSVALPLWKQAFARFTPAAPPCPDDLNLPQYANLLFGRTCYECDRTRGLTSAWASRVRLCKPCFKKGFTEAHVPDGIKTSLEVLRTLCPTETVMLFNRAGQETKNKRYYRPAYEALLSDVEKAEKGSQEELDAFVVEMERKVDAKMKTGKRIEEWNDDIENDKAEAVERVERTRRMEIKRRLLRIDENFDYILRKLFDTEVFATLPGVGGSKPLTDKEWTRIQPLLVDTLHELRPIMVEKDVKQRIESLGRVLWHFLTLNPDMMPYAPDRWTLARLEPFDAIIFETPIERTVDPDRLLDHMDALPGVLKTWKEGCDKVLLRLLPPVSKRRGGGRSGLRKKVRVCPPSEEDLLGATTLFSCQWCSDILQYPSVLVHRCLYKVHNELDKRNWEVTGADKGADKNTNSEEDDAPSVQGSGELETPEKPKDNLRSCDPALLWNEGGKQVRYDATSVEAAKAVIEVLGHDPATATWEELDDANQRIECVRCTKNMRLVMDWRCAIVHERKLHANDNDQGNNPQHRWKAVDLSSTREAYEKEKIVHEDRLARRGLELPDHWRGKASRDCCANCGKFPIMFGIPDCDANDDYGYVPMGALTCLSCGKNRFMPNAVYRRPRDRYAPFHSNVGPVRIPM